MFDFVLESMGVDEKKRYVDIDFPPILDRESEKVIKAIVDVLGVIPELNVDEVKKLVLTTLGINDPSEVLDKIKPEEQAAVKLEKALRGLKEVLKRGNDGSR